MNSIRLATLPLQVGVLLVGLIRPELLPARTLVEPGGATVWKYLDDGVEPKTTWRQADYDDSRWKSGPAPLGFGESRLATQVNPGAGAKQRTATFWFRREFDAPQLKSGESLALLLCVDDGAVVWLNGKEMGRVNMPQGPVRAGTLAAETIGNNDEGFYARLHAPAKALRPAAKNVLAVEVHQASATSSDLFFDLALKVLPATSGGAEASAAAMQTIELFNKRHYLGSGVTIPDGYIDGGRRMKVDAGGHAASGREILTVDRSRDTELAADLSFARSKELRALPELERIQKIAARIDQETTPPGGLHWVGKTTSQLEDEFTNQPVLIGDWVDQCQAGVCRHRALLFKILADEAGLKAALVRGNYARKGPPGIAHAWNEVQIDNGQRVLVDVMHHGGKPVFPPVNDPDVVRHYLKVDGTPWYGTAASRER
jgi:hypothetical protein